MTEKQPAPERGWVNTFTHLADIGTTSEKSTEIDLSSHVPDWAREVLLSATMFVKGTGTAGTVLLQEGNLYFWTQITRETGQVADASYQSRFGSVGGQATSVSLSGWCPVNKDHQKAWVEADLDPSAKTELLGGVIYLMGYRD